ncbi:MAG: hypothetical protein WBQ18_05910, partial [Solirubrobacteraceae bacterium]
VEPGPLTHFDLAELLDEEVSAQPDPSSGAGWRLTAVTDSEGGTTVLTWLHHAYGDGRAILETAFAPLPADAESAPPVPVGRRQELGDVVGRVRRGVIGGARLGREAATVGWREPRSDLARLGPAFTALRTRDRSVGARSQRRVVALARVDAELWDGVAAARGGSGNALLLAVLANLLRMARLSRGEARERPLRLLLPFDTRAADRGRGGAPADSSANAAGAAIVVVPGGLPEHRRLEDVRTATRDALRRATAAMAPNASAHPPGVVDAMQLLPNGITHRLASRVQAYADGVASNVGPIPGHVAGLGPHTASEVFLVAGPMLTDLTVCLGRQDGHIALGVVADPARLGPAGGLREQLADELAAWGLEPHLR